MCVASRSARRSSGFPVTAVQTRVGPIASKEYMFPFVTVVECPEAKLLEAMGPTLVCTAVTEKPELRRALLDATHIDRLNLGPVPTIRLNWLQPHEGNIVDFLYRPRALQSASMSSM